MYSRNRAWSALASSHRSTALCNYTVYTTPCMFLPGANSRLLRLHVHLLRRKNSFVLVPSPKFEWLTAFVPRKWDIGIGRCFYWVTQKTLFNNYMISSEKFLIICTKACNTPIYRAKCYIYITDLQNSTNFFSAVLLILYVDGKMYIVQCTYIDGEENYCVNYDENPIKTIVFIWCSIQLI